MATIASLVVSIGADIADLKTSTSKVESTLSGIEKTAASMGKMLAGAFTVGAVMQWTQQALSAAGRINDLSKKLGVSTDAIQRWDYAAQQGGQSIETIDRAVAFMNKTLAGGSNSAVKALEAAGLEFTAIRRMSPEQAFETIATAIEGIPDPMKRAEVAMKLFGKTGQDLLPAIEDGFIRTGEAASRMSEKTVRDLARADDAIATTSNWLKVQFGSALAFVIDKLYIYEAAIRQVNGLQDEYNAELEAVTGQIKKMVPDLQRQVDTTAKLVPTSTSAKDALKLFDAANKDNEDQLKKSWAAQDHYNEQLRELADTLTGKKMEAEVKKLADAVKLAGGEAKITAAQKQDLGKKLADLTAQGAKLTPELKGIEQAYQRLQAQSFPVVTTQESIATAFGAVSINGGKALGTLEGMAKWAKDVQTFDPAKFLDGVKGMVTTVAGLGAEAPRTFSQNFGSVLQHDLPKAIMGAIQGGGNVLESAGSTIGSFLVSEEGFGGAITNGLKSAFGDKFGGALASLLPGIGSMVGPLVSNLFGKMFGSAGRDAVKEFANSMGGFDALREKLLPLGDVGERLWVNLTQGVGKNNPEQAQAAIEAITAALQEQQQFVDGLVPSWQDTLSLAEKYGIEVSGLGEKFEQARLGDMANTIAVDFRKLIAAGADMNTVLTGMQDEVQGVVTSALRMGLEIPDSLQPVIKKMAEMGLLTDENGQKLVDLSKLNFSESLSKSVDRIIDALDRLIAKLGGDVATAISEIPKEVNVDVRWKVGGFPGVEEGGGRTMPEMHNGGWIKAHNGMNKILGPGEVPIVALSGEAVLNRRAAARLGESGVAALNGGGGAVSLDLSAVVQELRGQRADARTAALAAPGMTARALRDAMMLAR